MVIGCGGVAQVAIQKCAQNDAVFDEICIASRTVSKCDDLKKKIEAEGKSRSKITTAKVNADSVDELIGSAVSGSDHHGRLPCMRRTLR